MTKSIKGAAVRLNIFLRVQHTFGAIETADRNFNGGMWDKITLVGAEFAYFDRGGIRDSFKVKLQVTNVTQRTATLYPGGIRSE